MILVVHPGGTVHCLYDEAVNLNALGQLSIQRASQVEPDSQGRWWADLWPVGGPCLGPFNLRSQALGAERAWLEDNLLAMERKL